MLLLYTSGPAFMDIFCARNSWLPRSRKIWSGYMSLSEKRRTTHSSWCAPRSTKSPLKMYLFTRLGVDIMPSSHPHAILCNGLSALYVATRVRRHAVDAKEGEQVAHLFTVGAVKSSAS